MLLNDYAAEFTDDGYRHLLPFIDYSVGVVGANHRWIADRQTPANGAVLTNFTPSVGNVDLVSSGTAPTMQTDEFGNRCIRFDGVDDVLGATLSDMQTVVLVARIKAATGTDEGIFHTGGTYIRRGTTDAMAITVTGTSSKFPAVNPNGPKYHVIQLAATSSLSRYAVDGVAAENGASTGVHSQFTIGRAGTYKTGYMEAYEAFGFPQALTLAEMANVRAAMIARFGSAIA